MDMIFDTNEFIITDGVLIKYCGEKESITIPVGVTKISGRAFASSTAKEIIFSEGVETIESFACAHMNELQKVYFPSSLREIGFNAFGDCKHLATAELIIPENAEVDPTAFEGCCKHSVREVGCDIAFKTDAETMEESFDIDVFDDDKLSDVIESYISTYIDDHETFNDIIDNTIEDALSSCDTKFCADGTIDIYAIGEELYSTAKDIIAASSISAVVTNVSPDEEPMPIEIDIKSILKKRVDDRANCEVWDMDVGNQVETIITSFLDEGKWNIGFRSKDGVIKSASFFSNIHYGGAWKDGEEAITPVLWFGTPENPMKRWTIDENIQPGEYEFWFIQDEQDALYEVVPDSKGCFDIWYFAECGRVFADISEIMSTCPVSFEEDDSSATIKKKIDDFFMDEFCAEDALHKEVLLDICCYSEKTSDMIGCGITLSCDHPTTDDLDICDIRDNLGESFWEMLCYFEGSARNAFENGYIEGKDYDDLFKVFGHFRFSCTVDDKPIDIDLGIDPDDYIYPLLVEYLEIEEL